MIYHRERRNRDFLTHWLQMALNRVSTVCPIRPINGGGRGWMVRTKRFNTPNLTGAFSCPCCASGSALASSGPRRLRALGLVLGLGMQVWGAKAVSGSPLGGLESAFSVQAQGGVLVCDGSLTQGLTQAHPGDWCHALKPLSGTEGIVRLAAGRREK